MHAPHQTQSRTEAINFCVALWKNDPRNRARRPLLVHNLETNQEDLNKSQTADEDGGEAELDEPETLEDGTHNARALFCLSLNNPFRRAAIALIEWKWLDMFIFSVIFANVVFMALEDPVDPRPSDDHKLLFEVSAYVFIAIFALECLLKIFAMGLILGRGAYLKDWGNWLDFFIVLTGVVDIFLIDRAAEQSSGTFNAFRTVRLLRPLRALRAIGRFKELRVLVQLLYSCMPMLLDVASLLFFIFFVFGIIGVKLWHGVLRGKCYSLTDGHMLHVKGAHNFVCSEVQGTQECPEGYACLQLGANPFNNVVNFDNILYSFLTIFQIMTMQGWNHVMYAVMDSFSIWCVLWFLLLILVGPFFALQLFLVVIANRYAEVRVHVYVFVYVCMYVCMYALKLFLVVIANRYAEVRVHVYVFVYVCMYVCMYVCPEAISGCHREQIC
jgi:hypothetical protein